MAAFHTDDPGIATLCLPAVVVHFCLLEREQAVTEALNKEGIGIGCLALVAETGSAAFVHQCLHVSADSAIESAAPGVGKHLANIKTAIDSAKAK